MAFTNTLLDLVKPSSSTALILPTQKPHRHVSYSTLNDLVVSQFRSILKNELGVAKGDVVAMSLINSLEFVVAFLGIGVSRAVSAPLNPAYSTSEVKFYLEDTKPVLLILPKGSASEGARAAFEAAKEIGVRVAEISIESGRVSLNITHQTSLPSRAKKAVQNVVYNVLTDLNPHPDDIALVLHTSGTTGRPKSVPLTHANLIATTQNIIATYALTSSDTSFLCMPLFHVHGLLAGLLAPLASGGRIVVPAKFSASTFWEDFISANATWYTAVPTIHTILLNNTPVPNPLPKIRFIRSCSSALSPTTLYRLEEVFKAPVLEAYAMTEAAHQMTSNLSSFSLNGGTRVPGTVGVGVGVEVSVRDMTDGQEVPRGSIGEVCVRGPNVTKGYWAGDSVNKDAFWEGRWFRTGDQGLIQPTAPHHLQLTGRLKELINRAGEKISPLEIDHALLAIDGIGEAVAFGVPEKTYGEIVWAAVVMKDGNKETERDVEARIKKALAGKISKFKIPVRIVVTNSIPKTATGKIQRRHVRDAMLEREEDKSKIKAKL